MTVFQWFIVVYTAFIVVLGMIAHGKPRTGNINFSEVALRLAAINWALWYAGAWN